MTVEAALAPTSGAMVGSPAAAPTHPVVGSPATAPTHPAGNAAGSSARTSSAATISTSSLLAAAGVTPVDDSASGSPEEQAARVDSAIFAAPIHRMMTRNRASVLCPSTRYSSDEYACAAATSTP